MKKLKHSPDFGDFCHLPRTVTIDGNIYPIRWDFSAAIRFMEYVDGSEDEDEIFLKNVLNIWYPKVPENTDEALTQAIRFYCGGNLPQEGYYAPIFAPQGNREDLYLGFLKRYGIDLNRDAVHWWVFCRLLEHWKGEQTNGYGTND